MSRSTESLPKKLRQQMESNSRSSHTLVESGELEMEDLPPPPDRARTQPLSVLNGANGVHGISEHTHTDHESELESTSEHPLHAFDDSDLPRKKTFMSSLPFIGDYMDEAPNPGPNVTRKDRELFTSTGRTVRMPEPGERPKTGVVRHHSAGFFTITRRASGGSLAAQRTKSSTTPRYVLQDSAGREVKRHHSVTGTYRFDNRTEVEQAPNAHDDEAQHHAEKEKVGDGVDKKEVVVEVHEQQDDREAVDPKYVNTDPKQGLTDAEVLERVTVFGYNELVEKKTNPILKFLSYFTGSIAYLIEAACILSAILEDWTDFGIILALLFVNALIGFIEEARAESAIESLRSTLALKTTVVRNGHFTEVPARELVPGDVISLRLGDIVPADSKLLGLNGNFEETKHELSIDQSALTGESLPVQRGKDSTVWSGTIVKQGQQLAVVTHTGEKTFLGRAAHLISITEESGHFQKVITQIGNFIILITLVLVAIILIAALAQGKSFLTELNYALVLTIASIPVGLPTVLSVTMAVGAKQLAAKHVIVKRLTAVEEMAGLNILCSDKTGTLTLNQLSLDEPYLVDEKTADENELLLDAFLASEAGAKDAIELCVREQAAVRVPALKGVDHNSAIIPNFKQLEFQPFDPVSKLTRATIQNLTTGEIFCVAKGAPQVIITLANHKDEDAERAIISMAKRGLRPLAVGRSDPIKSVNDTNVKWNLVGMLSLLDPPRPDSAATIASCKEMGLSVKMITGDAVLIAKEVAKRLGMHQNILRSNKLSSAKESEEAIVGYCARADGFAQVVPEDKFRVVELLQKAGHMVGMTGDGVNDAPALKRANVGIAVHGCTDAARSASDIVLLQPGLSTIVDGIIASRMIFQRMRSYAVYRITSTVHFMVFMFFTILILNWSLPPSHIVLIALLNDAATIVISVDNALVSQKPDKWRLGQLMTLSVVLGLMLVASSFAHYFVAKYYFYVTSDELDTIMYLQMSSCPHFVIFSTRLSVLWYKNFPSLVFFIAIVGTQIFAMFISVYGVIVSPIGWPWAASVMCISVGWFMVIDLVKCYIYSIWNFELTAKLWPSSERRQKLTRRRERKAMLERYESNVERVRKVVKMIHVVKHWGSGAHYQPLPEPVIAFVPQKH